MAKRIKAQASLEFMILCGLGLLIVISTITFATEELGKISIEKEEKLIINLANQINREINFAANSKNGYERTFKLPNKIEKYDYSIEIVNNYIIIKTKNLNHEFKANEFNGNIVKGTNIIKKQNNIITIKND